MTRAYAWLIVRLRYVVIPLWIAVAVLAAVRLPGIGAGAADPLGGLVPHGARAIAVEQREYATFHSTILSRVAVVQRRARGFRKGEETRVYERALRIDQKKQPLFRHIAFALPITNARGIFPSSRERDTTAITFLYFRPAISTHAQLALADSYAERIANHGDALIGVTGALPARAAEFEAIDSALPRVTLATIALIAIVLLLAYRSVGPPLVALGAAGIVYVIAIHVLAWFARRRGATIPEEVEPVMVALLLGLVTDYSIFFFSGMRRRLERGARSFDAATEATRLYTPIILTAGLIVAAGALTLVAGRLPMFRAFGPGLALTVGVSLVVALTLLPACLATFGRLLFWPRFRPPVAPAAEDDDVAGFFPRLRTARPVSFVVALVVVAALGAGAFWLKDTALGFTLIRGQPAHNEVKRAELAASVGFDRGIVAPTEILLTGTDFRLHLPQLARFQRLVERRRGVAGVIGPEQLLRRRNLPVLVSRDGQSARLAVVFKQEPLGSNAIHLYRNLAAATPALLDRAGLDGADAAFAGDTAIAAETIDGVRGDIKRVAAAVLLANLFLLALFLRAFLAPLYLLAASTLGLAATLGLTTLVFEHVLGHQDLTYYVPFAASVLLLSLGSDYNLFVVGRIWQETERRPLREAVAYAVPAASGTIAIAGITLASSFALLALVPIRPMHELAFAMAAGILVDTFVVRSLLVPSLVVVFGRWNWWPRHTAVTERAADPASSSGSPGYTE